MQTHIATVEGLLCEECNTRIAKGTAYVELTTALTTDSLWLHETCYAALLAGIDAWLTEEEGKTQPGCSADDIPF